MPKRAAIATRQYLQQVPLPIHANSYTVIGHETVMVNALEQLKLKGFTVDKETYRANNSGEVALGIYQLKYENDPDLSMMFAWANSYDKTMRFKCAVGGFVKSSGSCVIQGDFSWGRKHTGTADSEMISQVTNQILNGKIYYESILKVKEQMKDRIITKNELAEFLGRAFFINSLFSKEQIGIVYDEIIKPSYDYNADPDSLWTNYNHMLVALQKAHPRTWMEEQRDLHQQVCLEFGISTNSVVKATVKEVDPQEVPHLMKVNMEEFAEILEDKKIEEKSNFEKVITSPESDVSAEDQAIIDARIADLEKVTIRVPNLNLPD